MNRHHRRPRATLAGLLTLLALAFFVEPADSHVAGWADLYNVGYTIAVHDSNGSHTYAQSQFDGTYSWSQIGMQRRGSSSNARTRVGVHVAERLTGYAMMYSAVMWRYRHQYEGVHNSFGSSCDSPQGPFVYDDGDTFYMDTSAYNWQTAEKNWRLEKPHSNVVYTGSGTKLWEYFTFFYTNIAGYYNDMDQACYSIWWID